MKKLSICLLVFIMLISSAFLGCGEQSSSQTLKEPLSFKQTTNVLINNGVSDYKIVVPANATQEQLYPAQELQLFLYKSTNCNLPIIEDANLVSDAENTYISVGNTSLFKAQNIKVEKSTYGNMGVSIDAVGKSVYITSTTNAGVLNAVYRFLHYQIGFEGYATDFVDFKYFNKLYLLDFDYHYTPSIQYFVSSEAELWKDYKNNSRVFVQGWKDDGGHNLDGAIMDEWCHTTTKILDPKTYAPLHPEWFQAGQMCYTNEELIEQFAANICKKYLFRKTPYIMIGGSDNTSSCPCDNCREKFPKYGGQPGIFVIFLNKVADYIEKYMAENDIVKDYTLVGLMYSAYEAPPVEERNGKLVALDESLYTDNEGQVKVGVCYAPMLACYTHSLGDSSCKENKGYSLGIRGWDLLTENLFIYAYGYHFYSNVFFYDYWSALSEQYRLFEECDVKYVFDEGPSAYHTIFHELRVYVRSKLAWNASLDIRDLIDDFMDKYYGPGAKNMKKYFNDMLEHYQAIYALENQNHQGCYYSIENEKLWTMDTLLNQSATVMNAIYDVRNSKCTQRQKDEYEKRIYDEYLLINVNKYKLYSGSLSEEELTELEKLVAYADATLSRTAKYLK